MTTYRFIQIMPGATSGSERHFICDDDSTALAIARRMMKGDARLEVWRGATFVGHASEEPTAQERAVMTILNTILAEDRSEPKAIHGNGDSHDQ